MKTRAIFVSLALVISCMAKADTLQFTSFETFKAQMVKDMLKIGDFDTIVITDSRTIVINNPRIIDRSSSLLQPIETEGQMSYICRQIGFIGGEAIARNADATVAQLKCSLQ